MSVKIKRYLIASSLENTIRDLKLIFRKKYLTDRDIELILFIYTYVPEYRDHIKQLIEEFVHKTKTCPFEWYFIIPEFNPNHIELSIDPLYYQFLLYQYSPTLQGYYFCKSLKELIRNNVSDDLLISLSLYREQKLIPLLSEAYHCPSFSDQDKLKIANVITKILSETKDHFDDIYMFSSLISIPEILIYLREQKLLLKKMNQDAKLAHIHKYISPFFAAVRNDNPDHVINAFNSLRHVVTTHTPDVQEINALLACFARTITSTEVFMDLLFKLKCNPAYFFFNSPLIATLDSKTLKDATKHIKQFTVKAGIWAYKTMYPVVTLPDDSEIYDLLFTYFQNYFEIQSLQLMSNLKVGFNFITGKSYDPEIAKFYSLLEFE